jgi:hypothetical protein
MLYILINKLYFLICKLNFFQYFTLYNNYLLLFQKKYYFCNYRFVILNKNYNKITSTFIFNYFVML